MARMTLLEPDAEPDHQDEREDHRRKRHPDIDQAADDPIDGAAEIAGNMRQDRADDHGAERREQRHQHRGARAIDQARQHVSGRGCRCPAENSDRRRRPMPAACRIDSRFCSPGSCGAIQPAKTAQKPMQTIMPSAIRTLGERSERDIAAAHQRTRSFGLSTT